MSLYGCSEIGEVGCAMYSTSRKLLVVALDVKVSDCHAVSILLCTRAFKVDQELDELIA
jgi:hypothetical protein